MAQPDQGRRSGNDEHAARAQISRTASSADPFEMDAKDLGHRHQDQR
jgi:hypothetical protein